MIDLKAKREELQGAARKAQESIAQSRDHLNYINGAVTILNELIADQEATTTATITTSADVPPKKGKTK
jgi:hypothetical protein